MKNFAPFLACKLTVSISRSITPPIVLLFDFHLPAEFPTRLESCCTPSRRISHQTYAKRRTKVKKERERGSEAGAAASGGSTTTAQPWPALKKRSAILSRNELRELDLFTVPNFLSVKECETFVQNALALVFQHQGSRGPAYGEAYRDNGRVSVQSPALADRLWEAGLNSVFSDIDVRGRRAVGLNPNIRFYRYTVGQHFGQHIDESVELGGNLATEYTLLIYLSGGEESIVKGKASREVLVGGETVFYNRRRVVAEVPPVAGMALFHIHGQHCMLHEARVVAKGVKYVLRSDVIFS
ncbi:hypothetical protein R1flu_009299 [Riccia fluitans]|uniref:Fe2OG dioxygenase domain-containing protein n=1 Tax=Riccia fluitans TaxID=41844 RepID=A0ABD1Z1Q3_9MARC